MANHNVFLFNINLRGKVPASGLCDLINLSYLIHAAIFNIPCRFIDGIFVETRCKKMFLRVYGANNTFIWNERTASVRAGKDVLDCLHLIELQLWQCYSEFRCD